MARSAALLPERDGLARRYACVVPPDGSSRTNPDERPAKSSERRGVRSSERCDRHPGSQAVARCDGCGRPLCLSCAIPVRGQAFGTECLPGVLGVDAPTEPEVPTRARDAVPRTITTIAFGFAVLATVVPWSRFGPGSDAFGAWSRSARWSVVAAIAAVAGLVLTLTQRRGRSRTARRDAIVTALAVAVVIASAMSLLFPPAFSRPWIGPWAAVAAGSVGAAASFVAGRTAAAPAAVRS